MFLALKDLLMTDAMPSHSRIDLAAEIISAFVSNNTVSAEELPSLISQVHIALDNLGKPVATQAEKPIPPVPIKKTVTPDHLISLEDGKRYKSLRRHLSTRGLTPEQYREKWGLRRDYPMVAPNYSAQRSELARSLGISRKRTGGTKQAVRHAATSSKVTGDGSKGRGRRNAG